VRKIDPSKVRGIVVVVDCETCEGIGKVYRSDGARHATECPTCDGDGMQTPRLSMDAFHRLLAATAPKATP
jgi:predicted Zn-ribbon and HTH transcriptional regulator